MSIRPQDVSECRNVTESAALGGVSVMAVLLAVKENKVYLPDLPLIVCTWGLSVEKIPEK